MKCSFHTGELKMDKKNLSKHKHVWKVVREFGSGIYHAYKYPVIYINSQLTYYSSGEANA